MYTLIPVENKNCKETLTYVHKNYYTRFQCYVHRQHLRSSLDMPSFDMLCDLAHIITDSFTVELVF